MGGERLCEAPQVSCLARIPPVCAGMSWSCAVKSPSAAMPKRLSPPEKPQLNLGRASAPAANIASFSQLWKLASEEHIR